MTPGPLLAPYRSRTPPSPLSLTESERARAAAVAAQRAATHSHTREPRGKQSDRSTSRYILEYLIRKARIHTSPPLCMVSESQTYTALLPHACTYAGRCRYAFVWVPVRGSSVCETLQSVAADDRFHFRVPCMYNVFACEVAF